MKIDIVGGEKYSLTLVAENKNENVELLQLAIQMNEQGTTKVKSKVSEEGHERKPYKKQRATRCPDCGLRVKGNIGLGLHRAKSPTCKGTNGKHHDTVACEYCGKDCLPSGINIHIAKKHPSERRVNHAEAEVKPRTNFLGADFGKMKSEIIV